MSTPKLLLVINDAAFFLSHRLCIARAAAEAGYEVHVATAPGAETRAIEAAGLAFHRVPISRRGVNPWHELRAFGSLWRHYRSLRPDVVHHVTVKPVLYGGLAARLVGVPAVANAVPGLGYVFGASGWKAALLRAVVRQGYRWALGHPNTRVIFQNPDDRAAFLHHGLTSPDDCVLIRGSGVDMAEFVLAPESEGAPLVLFASRLLWDKGVGEFVAAARALKAGGTEARFVLVGDSDPGNPAAIPTAQVEAWRESGVIEWWGRRADMPRVLARAHVVCLPSYYGEGLPKVLIEAAACGRAIVTTDAPGCREVVRHEENGLLVPVRDSAALAAAVRRLIQDPALRRRLGARGREIAEAEFSQERVVADTLAVYRVLLDGCPALRPRVA